MAVHGFRGAIGRLACGLPVGLRLQSYQTLPEKRRTRWAYLPNPGWLWRFFAHGFGSLAAMPARRGVHVAAARGLAPLSAFCPTNAIPYICIMLFKHPDRLSFLMPAALFRLGPVGLCQWPRSICLPMAPICFATWRQFGLRRVFACTMPCMVRLAVDVASVDENVWFLSMPSLALALGPGSGGLGYVPFCSLKRAVLIGQTCRSAQQNGTFGAEASVA